MVSKWSRQPTEQKYHVTPSRTAVGAPATATVMPQTGSIGAGISILSYNGRVHFGLIADAKLIPDPDSVIGRFGSEFDKLLYLSLMSDWDTRLDGHLADALLPEDTRRAIEFLAS